MYLMVAQTKVTNKPIVLENIGSQFLYPRLVLEMSIALQETFIELNDLT
jgi:hypothetical protein